MNGRDSSFIIHNSAFIINQAALRREANDEMAFEYPHIARGDRVEVSNDPSRGDRVFGEVIDAKNGCADIHFITPDGFGVKRNCWYEGDPRCIEHPEHFEGNASGVFSLCESELRQRELLRRLDALDANQAVLGSELALLKEQANGKPAPGRRGRKQEAVGSMQ